MKKLVVPLVILLIAAFIITGCSSGTASPSATTTAPTTTAPTITSSTTTAPTTSAAKPTATTAPPTTTTAPPTSTTVSPPPTGRYGGILRYIQPAGPATPIGTPWEATGGSVSTMAYSIEPPLREDLGGKLVGRLMTSWQVNATGDNPNIVFTLRKGVKFSDGSDFNAQAAAWAFQKSKEGAMQAATTNFWKSFDVIDDYTLRVNFTQWKNTFLRGFSENVAMISSPTAFQKNSIDWLRVNMVGTGPFLQTTYQRDVTFKGSKNPSYWDKGYPYVDEVQVLYVADMLTRDALFKSGGAEMMDIMPQQAATYQSPDYKIITQPTGVTALFPDSLNADSPWSNAKVRQAAEYAIDKESLAKTFGYGYNQAAYQMVSSSSPAYDPNFSKARKYDVAKAKQLMTEAGYPNGFKTKIIAGPPGVNKDIVVAVQSYLGKIGIQCDLDFPEAAAYQAYATGTWKNALIYNALLEWPNPNTALNFYYGVPVSSWFQSLKKPDGWSSLFTATISSPDVDLNLVKKCYDALYDDTTLITLFYGSTLWLEKANVQDSGHGKRGNPVYYNPQFTWLSK